MVYEYKVAAMRAGLGLTYNLNKLGSEGWKIVACFTPMEHETQVFVFCRRRWLPRRKKVISHEASK